MSFPARLIEQGQPLVAPPQGLLCPLALRNVKSVHVDILSTRRRCESQEKCTLIALDLRLLPKTRTDDILNKSLPVNRYTLAQLTFPQTQQGLACFVGVKHSPVSSNSKSFLTLQRCLLRSLMFDLQSLKLDNPPAHPCQLTDELLPSLCLISHIGLRAAHDDSGISASVLSRCAIHYF